MSLHTTDLRLVICSFGPIAFSNYGEGAAISIDPEADLFNVKVSGDGKTTRARVGNNNYIATITLMESSEANAKMILQTLRNAALSLLTYPFAYINPRNGEQCFASEAFVHKMPGMEASNEASEREWAIYLPDAKVTPVDNLDLGYIQ